MRSHGREPVDPVRQKHGEPPQGGGMSIRHGREPMERWDSSTGMQFAGLSCTQPGDPQGRCVRGPRACALGDDVPPPCGGSIILFRFNPRACALGDKMPPPGGGSII
jgi:hypothetical protein